MKVESVEQEINDGDGAEPTENYGFDDDEPGYMGGIQTVSPGTDVYESRVKKLGDVLGRPYKVPDYQRQYTWKVKLVNKLWEDLTNRYTQNKDFKTGEMPLSDEYLLGPIVFAKEEKTHHDIVDGQQRLVTLTLLFCAIRDAVNTFGSERTGEDRELFKTFVYNINKIAMNDNNDALIKLNTHELNEAYQHIIGGNPPKTLPDNVKKDPGAARIIGNYRELFRNAREFCAKMGLDTTGVKLIKRLNKLYELTTDIKAKNVFVHITIDNDKWAPHVFESLNGKSEPLTQSALIKSYLLHKLRVDGSGDADAFTTKWYQITKKVETNANSKSSMDAFLYESALSRRTYAEPVKEGISKFYQSNIIRKHLYAYLKSYCQTKNDIQTYIGHLDTDVQNVVYALNPDRLQESHPANFKHALASVSLLNANYIRRPIVAACREWGIADKETIALANWLHMYFFVEVRVSEHKIDNIKRISKCVVEEITGKKRLRDILNNPKIFEQAKIDKYDQEFKDKFLNIVKRPITSDTAKYVLVCIERHLKPNSEISIYADKIEIEHIFPKNPEMGDNGWTNTDLSKDFLNKLGNLTILTPPYNKDVANYGFAYKKGSQYTSYYCYAKSELSINKNYLMKYNEWNKEQLLDRENSLCNIATEVWRLRSCFDQTYLSLE